MTTAETLAQSISQDINNFGGENAPGEFVTVQEGANGNYLIMGPYPSFMINVPGDEETPIAFLTDVLADAGLIASLLEMLLSKHGARLRYSGVYAVSPEGKLIYDQEYIINNKLTLMKQFVARALVQEAMEKAQQPSILVPAEQKIILPGA